MALDLIYTVCQSLNETFIKPHLLRQHLAVAQSFSLELIQLLTQNLKKKLAADARAFFSAPAAIELYTQFFMEQNSLSKLEGFASFFGADFYGQPRNQEKITLENIPWRMPDQYQLGDVPTVPIFAGQTINWRLKDDIEK